MLYFQPDDSCEEADKTNQYLGNNLNQVGQNLLKFSKSHLQPFKSHQTSPGVWWVRIFFCEKMGNFTTGQSEHRKQAHSLRALVPSPRTFTSPQLLQYVQFFPWYWIVFISYRYSTPKQKYDWLEFPAVISLIRSVLPRMAPCHGPWGPRGLFDTTILPSTSTMPQARTIRPESNSSWSVQYDTERPCLVQLFPFAPCEFWPIEKPSLLNVLSTPSLPLLLHLASLALVEPSQSYADLVQQNS